jgi:hypothetical protein
MRKLILAAAVMLAACDGGADFSNSTGPVSQPVTTGKSDFALAAGKPTLLHVSSVSVTEGQTARPVVGVSGGNGKPITIAWTSGNLSGSVVVGTKTPATISIPVADNLVVDGTRTQSVCARATSGTTGVSACGTVTVLDNDVAPLPPPPPPPTQTCPDGSVILASDACPAPPPPPPPATQTCPDGSVIPATDMCPMPPPAGDILSPSLSGLPSIASNFDYNTGIEPAPVPGSNVPDTLGAFRFVCGAGQLLRDDPIMFPGQPGKSHLHQFYGNLSANGNSTYGSLRASGASTCGNPAGTPVNRSAYWMPALLDGLGHVIQPDQTVVYYKRYPATSWQCTDGRVANGCLPLPNGLRYIFGRDMSNLAAPPTGSFHFLCYDPANSQGSVSTLAAALVNCRAGAQLVATINAPSCWDGKRLDSANHRDHVAYMVDSHNGYVKCPDDHPYVIPEFTMNTYYRVVAGEDMSRWHFSSDEMAPNEPAGSTYHADWFGAWDDTVKMMWTDNCINKLLNCSSGILGNGYEMKGTSQPYYNGVQTWNNPNRLVPVPARP